MYIQMRVNEEFKRLAIELSKIRRYDTLTEYIKELIRQDKIKYDNEKRAV